MSDFKFAKYTEKIRSMLPFWFQMRKQPAESIGLQFLNFFGIQLDDIEYILNYAYKQTRIEDADTKFVDIVYKAILPSYYDMSSIKIISTRHELLSKADKLYDFFGLGYNYGMIDNNIMQPDYYFLDIENKIIYVREAYDIDDNYESGQITVELKDGTINTFALSVHHIWNYFDEFGALLSCPRLYGEKNEEYKNRILDVFRNPANSSKQGLANAISRELGMRKHKVWKDTNEDFVIKDSMVIANLIKVKNEIVKEEDILYTPEGYLVIKALGTNERYVEVSYISGLEIKALIDHSNNKFSNETYNANGMPKDLMLKYVKNIKNNCSIMWDDFMYNEACWIQNSDEYKVDTFGFIPATYDSNIKGFSDYGYFDKGGYERW
ncbi:Low copy number virion structural protein [Clostridium saccharoperbutylacetonicum]